MKKGKMTSSTLQECSEGLGYGQACSSTYS